jgi:hypothetical protein
LNEYQRTKNYTKRRIKQLRGDLVDIEPLDAEIESYVRRRLSELRLESKARKNTVSIDNMLYNRYAYATMEVYGGDD